MEEQGFGGMAAPAPTMSMEAMDAVHCWRWCKGWQPERWPAYDALHDVADWSLLAELMEHLRDNT